MANPVYNISMQRTPQQGMITTSTAVATTTRGDAAAVEYEDVSNKPSTTITASQLATDVWGKEKLTCYYIDRKEEVICYAKIVKLFV